MPCQEAIEHYRHVRQECDVLILLTHVGVDYDKVLAELFPEADAIIGGHTHTTIADECLVNGVLITQAANKLKYISRLTFSVEDGCVKHKTAALISLDDVPAHAGYIEKIEAIKSDSYFKRVVAQVKNNIESRESFFGGGLWLMLFVIRLKPILLL